MSKLIRSDLARLLYDKVEDYIRQRKASIHSGATEQELEEYNNNIALNSLSEHDINILIKLCTQTISEMIIAGNSIELRDFGVFELRVRKAKTKARNPKTGEVVTVPEHTVVAFRAGKRLKDAVWSLSDG